MNVQICIRYIALLICTLVHVESKALEPEIYESLYQTYLSPLVAEFGRLDSGNTQWEITKHTWSEQFVFSEIWKIDLPNKKAELTVEQKIFDEKGDLTEEPGKSKIIISDGNIYQDAGMNVWLRLTKNEFSIIERPLLRLFNEISVQRSPIINGLEESTDDTLKSIINAEQHDEIISTLKVKQALEKKSLDENLEIDSKLLYLSLSSKANGHIDTFYLSLATGWKYYFEIRSAANRLQISLPDNVQITDLSKRDLLFGKKIFGFVLNKSKDGKFYVVQAIPDSSFVSAGGKMEDELVSVNNKKLDGSMSIDEVNGLFSSLDSVKLELRSNNSPVHINIDRR